jgi:hypothetical protein
MTGIPAALTRIEWRQTIDVSTKNTTITNTWEVA